MHKFLLVVSLLFAPATFAETSQPYTGLSAQDRVDIMNICLAARVPAWFKQEDVQLRCACWIIKTEEYSLSIQKTISELWSPQERMELQLNLSICEPKGRHNDF